MEAVTQFLQTAAQQAALHIDADQRLYMEYDSKTCDITLVQRMRGLLPTLQRHFYPHYQSKKRKRCTSSTDLGERIDKEMQAFVANGRVLPPGHHPFSFKLACAFQRYRLQLLATQVPLFDAKQRILTYIDAVGLDHRTNPPTPFLADFKTGYDVGYTSSCGTMLEPFSMVPNHYKNQHHLQLAWEVAVAAQPPYNTEFQNAYILLVNHTKRHAKKIHLPQWCTKKRCDSMIHLLRIKT